MTTINIAYAATQDWFNYTEVSVYSILQNAKLEDNYHFFILSDKFTEKDKNDFLLLNKVKKSEYTFITLDNNDFNNFFNNPLGNSTNYRLKLASITNVDKMLYLDSDTFALTDISSITSEGGICIFFPSSVTFAMFLLSLRWPTASLANQ